jgi:RHS repeat-associated protein
MSGHLRTAVHAMFYSFNARRVSMVGALASLRSAFRRYVAHGQRLYRFGTLVMLVSTCLIAGLTSASAQTEIIEYYATDAVGSIRVVFAPDGTVKARADYLPFGEELPTTPVGQLPSQRFTGQQRDSEEGLDNFNARSYQTRTGRMTTVDPVFAGLFEPQRWNRYAYASNSPLVYVDPDGRQDVPAGQEGKPVFRTSNTPNTYDPTPGFMIQWANSHWARNGGDYTDFGLGSVSPHIAEDNARALDFLAAVVKRALDLVPGTTTVGGPESELVPTKQPDELGTGAGLAVDATFLALGALVPGDNGEKAIAGRIGQEIVDTFRGKIRPVVLKNDVVAIRYWDGVDAKEFGRFLTTRQTDKIISSPGSAQSALNLVNNAAVERTHFVIPAGTTVYMGRIRGGAPGATQVFVPDSSVLIRR